MFSFLQLLKCEYSRDLKSDYSKYVLFEGRILNGSSIQNLDFCWGFEGLGPFKASVVQILGICDTNYSKSLIPKWTIFFGF